MNGNEANKILVGKAIKGKLFSRSLSLKNDDYNDGGGGEGGSEGIAKEYVFSQKFSSSLGLAAGKNLLSIDEQQQ